METVSTSETSVISSRLHGTTSLKTAIHILSGTELCSPGRNEETMMWVVAKRRKYIYYSEWKYWPSSPFLCLQSLHADFFQYSSGITKQECNSPRADPVHITEHRLSVAGFSPQRHIFRVDINCVHRISSVLLIDSVAFSHSTSSLSVPRPAGLQSSDPNNTCRRENVISHLVMSCYCS
jgi:hypothetical protein